MFAEQEQEKEHLQNVQKDHARNGKTPIAWCYNGILLYKKAVCQRQHREYYYIPQSKIAILWEIAEITNSHL